MGILIKFEQMESSDLQLTHATEFATRLVGAPGGDLWGGYSGHVVNFYLYSLALTYRGLASWITTPQLFIVATILGFNVDLFRIMIDYGQSWGKHLQWCMSW